MGVGVGVGVGVGGGVGGVISPQEEEEEEELLVLKDRGKKWKAKLLNQGNKFIARMLKLIRGRNS